MKIRFWGTRGSIPAPGPSTARYGGNTSCVELRLRDGTLVILDAGSGIRPLGADLGPSTATILLSHYHWDHIQGIPFFQPAYDPGSTIDIVGPTYRGVGPERYVAQQMNQPFFPAPVSELRACRNWQVTPSGSFRLGTARICSAQVSHPGMTLGYRIEEAGHTLVYISDNEVDVASPELMAGMVQLAAGADVLIHDCQYFESEYPSKRGWGHSTPRQAMRLACEAGVRHLVLFHHDPSHSDEQVDAMAEEARALATGMPLSIGREGECLDIAAPRVRPLPVEDALREL